MDLIGKYFGRLHIIANSTNRKGYVVCECECGKRKEIRATSLTQTKAPTRSCGCIQREKASSVGGKNISKNSENRLNTMRRFNTNFDVIENPNPPKNNRSGQKGVWYDVKKDNYQVYIGIHGKRVSLGRAPTFEEAVKRRKEAEEKYFSPIISEKEKELGCF